MMSRNKIIIGALSLGILAGGLLFFRSSEISDLSFNLANIFSSQDPKIPGDSGEFGVYSNPDYGFSFEYPADMQIMELDEVAGKIILGEGPQGAFQIFIMPFDEPGPLTAERIKKDLPNLTMKNPSPSKINEVEAVSFIGSGGDIKTAELWFVSPKDPYPHGNYLYQFTTKLENANFIEEIMETWKFLQ